jgi:orotidine-5'-phosphate decarboxylase
MIQIRENHMPSELIVALDVPNIARIAPLVEQMPPEVTYFKVGLELFVAGGPDGLRPLRDRGMRIFLDLKLHDIPRTVARAVRAAARHGVTMLTVHAGGGRAMLAAAAQAAAELGPDAPALVAVTTLTSLDQNDLNDLGIARALAEHTHALGQMAIDSGIDGLVCSPLEVGEFRRRLGPAPLLVTPGIRSSGDAVGDQKRIATPRMAVDAGASCLVVGRPIVEAADPGRAARQILNEMNG